MQQMKDTYGQLLMTKKLVARAMQKELKESCLCARFSGSFSMKYIKKHRR